MHTCTEYILLSCYIVDTYMYRVHSLILLHCRYIHVEYILLSCYIIDTYMYRVHSLILLHCRYIHVEYILLSSYIVDTYIYRVHSLILLHCIYIHIQSTFSYPVTLYIHTCTEYFSVHVCIYNVTG
jgi:hypothetical protein